MDSLNILPSTYEECGLLGGRTIHESGFECILKGDTDIYNMFGLMAIYAQESFQNPDYLYPFERIAICVILADGNLLYVFVNGDDVGKNSFSYHEEVLGTETFPDYRDIGLSFSAFGAQRYDIFKQTGERTFQTLKYKTTKSEEKFGHAYDVFRCLDLQGDCKIRKVTKNRHFHNYTRYDLGEDFYIEAYDNEVTQAREFWLCREYMFQKHLIITYDFQEPDYLGLFNEEDDLIIDQHIAELLCKLTYKGEFLFINNNFELEMRGLKDPE